MKFQKENNMDYQFNIILPTITLVACFITGINFLLAGILTIVAIFVGLIVDLIMLKNNKGDYSKIMEIQNLAKKIMKSYEEIPSETKNEEKTIQSDNKESDRTLMAIAKDEIYFTESKPSFIKEKLEIAKIDDNDNSLDDIATFAEKELSRVVKLVNSKTTSENTEIDEKEIKLIEEISGINSEFSKVISEIWEKPKEKNSRSHLNQILNTPQESFMEEINTLKEEILDKVNSENYIKSEISNISKSEIYENIDKKEKIITKAEEEVVTS